MNWALFILLATGAGAIAGAFLAWLGGGQQEDFGSAIGGVVGLVIANGTAIYLRGFANGRDSTSGTLSNSASCESGFAYGVFAIAYFAFAGWLTGYLHGHGDFAGTVCGGLGGFILAVTVPAFHRSSFMAAGRKIQLAFSVAAFVALLAIVWMMYKHEFLRQAGGWPRSVHSFGVMSRQPDLRYRADYRDHLPRKQFQRSFHLCRTTRGAMFSGKADGLRDESCAGNRSRVPGLGVGWEGGLTHGDYEASDALAGCGASFYDYAPNRGYRPGFSMDVGPFSVRLAVAEPLSG
ncbi:MAG: hypothetical protein R3C99_19655 [Pirellulaceae bacterium]